MAFTLLEWFGYDLTANSTVAHAAQHTEQCPFIDDDCTKLFRDGSRSGVCSVELRDGANVIICPNRMYAGKYQILSDVAEAAFGPNRRIIHPSAVKQVPHDGNNVVAFGKRYGGELRLPSVGGRRSYFVDWILARIAPSGALAEFVALEVQTIDTTGSYNDAVQQLRAGASGYQSAKAGLNWENVNKRILPQLIYKGHVLRREPLCTKGLFFVCPDAVYQRVDERLGNSMMEYKNLQPGSLTFFTYSLGTVQQTGQRTMLKRSKFSTTVDQVALAFTSPQNLPAAGVYETAIRSALDGA